MAGQYFNPFAVSALTVLLAVSCLAESKLKTDSTLLRALVKRQAGLRIQCPGYNANFQDPSDCSSYYQCDNNRVVRMSCPFGQVFSPQSGNCGNFATPAGCSPSGRQGLNPSVNTYVCPQPNGRFQDTSDCSSFYICRNSRATRQQCPQQQLFDPNAEACSNIHDPEGCHMPENNPPPPPPSGQGDYQCPASHGLFHDTTDCSKYYRCDHWQPERRQCPPGQYYDPQHEICSSAHQPQGCHLVGGAGFQCQASFGNFQDTTDCSKYWSCNNFQATSNTCPPNQLFDTRTSQCSGSVTFVNGCTMPPNWTGGQPSGFQCPSSFGSFQDTTDCSKYWSCNNFQATSNTCPPNQLFDTRTSQCSGSVTFVNGCTMPPNWTGGQPSGSGNLVCPMSDKASLIPHPRICNAFYICGDGRMHRPCIFCGDGTYFDPEIMVCVSDAGVDFNAVCPGKVTVAHEDKVQAQVDGTC